MPRNHSPCTTGVHLLFWCRRPPGPKPRPRRTRARPGSKADLDEEYRPEDDDEEDEEEDHHIVDGPRITMHRRRSRPRRSAATPEQDRTAAAAAGLLEVANLERAQRKPMGEVKTTSEPPTLVPPTITAHGPQVRLPRRKADRPRPIVQLPTTGPGPVKLTLLPSLPFSSVPASMPNISMPVALRHLPPAGPPALFALLHAHLMQMGIEPTYHAPFMQPAETTNSWGAFGPQLQLPALPPLPAGSTGAVSPRNKRKLDEYEEAEARLVRNKSTFDGFHSVFVQIHSNLLRADFVRLPTTWWMPNLLPFLLLPIRTTCWQQ